MWAPRRTITVLVIAVVMPLVFSAGTLRCLWSAIRETDPSEKASMFAAAISELMNCFAFGVLAAIGLLAILNWAQEVFRRDKRD